LDRTAPPYVPGSKQKSSPTPSSSSCPRIIEVEMVTSISARSGKMSPHRIKDDGAASRQSSHSIRTEWSFQRQLREAVKRSLESHPLESHPQDPPLAVVDAASGETLVFPSSHHSAIDQRSASDPDPFSPVSIPPTLLPTPEPTYVSSKHNTNCMVDNGYWRAIDETPPQEASGTSLWSPPPLVSRTVKDDMETRIDAATEWLQRDSSSSPTPPQQDTYGSP
jgi:hypothetical protein